MKKKSRATIEDEKLDAALIAQAVSYSAFLRCGPDEKHVVRDIKTPELAFEKAAELEAKHSRFGRRSLVYAITPTNISVPITPELVEMARAL